MKIRPFLSFIVALGFLSAGRVAAQPRSLFKINLLSPLTSTANVAYERVVGTRNSFQLGVFYSGVRLSGVRYRGFGFTPEYRFYLANEAAAPRGFYLAPFVRYRRFELTDQNQPQLGGRLRTFGGGLTVGYQALFRDRFSLDAFLGPSLNSASLRANDGYSPRLPFGLFNGFGLRAGLTLGLAL